jgi:hypothetical protein
VNEGEREETSRDKKGANSTLKMVENRQQTWQKE